MISLLLHQQRSRVPLLPTWMRVHHRLMSQINTADSDTKHESEGETIREATLADFQAVLDIDRHAHFGLDTLPCTYQSLVEGSGVKAFVCEKGGEVVAFFSTQKVDGGRTLVTSAGRVREDWRGQGVYGRFKKRVISDLICRASPDVEDVVFVTYVDTFRDRLLKTNRLVMEKYVRTVQTITPIEVDLDKLKSAFRSRQMQPPFKLKALGYRNIHTMLHQSPAHLSHLFPQQRMVLAWNPYRIMADNAGVIFTTNRVFLAKNEELLSLASCDKGSNFPVTLMSSGNLLCPCERGCEYCLDVFGSGNNAELRAHIEWHLHHLAEVCEEKKAVVMVFYTRSVTEVWADIGKDFPSCLQPVDTQFKQISLWESEFSNTAL